VRGYRKLGPVGSLTIATEQSSGVVDHGVQRGGCRPDLFDEGFHLGWLDQVCRYYCGCAASVEDVLG
jgi:hypothetical protein